MIELLDLTAGYGSHEVLHGISACMVCGKLISVIGPNGCGKSTLFKTVPGILKKMHGEILLDGTPTEQYHTDTLAQRIAYLAQIHRTPDMTVGELVLHGRFPHLHFPRRYSARDREIAHEAMVHMGIDLYADKPVSSLSGGMRQCVYLAMAQAQDTDHILLDEPTTYLDIANRLSLMQQLRSLACEGKCVAAVMHDLPLALTYSDEIWVMRDGRIEAIGTPRQIADSGIIEAVFGVSVGCDGGNYFYRLQGI
ncbi:MAG: ABC transporter ATP-binding protein [Clostridia bacterium]|nr:ABC transporter ATP-binding protein [Clostridia bacterium]